MRTISFLWIILITNQLFTQKSNDFQFPFSVIDGVKINVDFPLYNCMIYEYHSQINEMRNSKYKFKLTDIEKKVFKSYSYYTNPFCNILNNKSDINFTVGTILSSQQFDSNIFQFLDDD